MQVSRLAHKPHRNKRGPRPVSPAPMRRCVAQTYAASSDRLIYRRTRPDSDYSCSGTSTPSLVSSDESEPPTSSESDEAAETVVLPRKRALTTGADWKVRGVRKVRALKATLEHRLRNNVISCAGTLLGATSNQMSAMRRLLGLVVTVPGGLTKQAVVRLNQVIGYGVPYLEHAKLLSVIGNESHIPLLAVNASVVALGQCLYYNGAPTHCTLDESALQAAEEAQAVGATFANPKLPSAARSALHSTACALTYTHVSPMEYNNIMCTLLFIAIRSCPTKKISHRMSGPCYPHVA